MLAVSASFYAKKLSTWESVPGEVIYAYVQNASAPIDAVAASGGVDRAILKYQYRIGGKSFIGTRLTFLQQVYVSRRMVGSIGSTIDVYYNPNYPEESYLYVDYPAVQISMMVFFSFCLFMLAVFWGNLVRIVKTILSPNSNLGSGGY